MLWHVELCTGHFVLTGAFIASWAPTCRCSSNYGDESSG
jgi:hypothetical protein